MSEPPHDPPEKTAFVGHSLDGTPARPANISDALRDAAEHAVRAGFVTKDRDVWFDVTAIEVELANQHVKTMRVIVTER